MAPILVNEMSLRDGKENRVLVRWSLPCRAAKSYSYTAPAANEGQQRQARACEDVVATATRPKWLERVA